MMIYGDPTPRMFKETYYRSLGDEELNILGGIEETATGRQCGEALIMGMNSWNWNGSSYDLEKYRGIAWERIKWQGVVGNDIEGKMTTNTDVLSDLFELLDGEYKYTAVTLLTNDAGMVKGENVTINLIRQIFDYDFIMDYFVHHAHLYHNISSNLPKRVNNWVPFAGKNWENIRAIKEALMDKGETFYDKFLGELDDYTIKMGVKTSARALDPDGWVPHFSTEKKYRKRYSREYKFFDYDASVLKLAKKAEEVWIANTISDEEVEQVVELAEGEVVLSEESPRITITNAPSTFLNLDEFQRNYDSIGLLTREHFKKIGEGMRKLSGNLNLDEIKQSTTTEEREQNHIYLNSLQASSKKSTPKTLVPAVLVEKPAMRKVMDKIQNGVALSESEEKLKGILESRGKGLDKKEKRRVANVLSEVMRKFRPELVILANRLKSDKVIRFDEAMEGIGCNEWFHKHEFVQNSFLYHCNTPGGQFYEYFPNATVDIKPRFISDEARKHIETFQKPDIYAFAVTEK